MRIIVDSKQPPEFQHVIKQAYPDTVVLSLGESSGDVLINTDGGKIIIIEIKEIPDLVSSIRDRRLFRQSEGIRNITPYAFLLIGGDLKYDKENNLVGRNRNGFGSLGITRDQVEGALTRVQYNGAIVRYAYRGYVDAIRLITNWVESSDKPISNRPEPPRLSVLEIEKQSAVNWLTCFDGIGAVQALNFVEYYGEKSPAEYLSLATVPFGKDRPKGWTNHTIEKCRKQLGLSGEMRLAVIKNQIEETPRPPKSEWREELDD